MGGWCSLGLGWVLSVLWAGCCVYEMTGAGYNNGIMGANTGTDYAITTTHLNLTELLFMCIFYFISDLFPTVHRSHIFFVSFVLRLLFALCYLASIYHLHHCYKVDYPPMPHVIIEARDIAHPHYPGPKS